MNIGKAVAICTKIDSEEYSIEDKLLAVLEVMNMPTHMGVTKDTLIGMIKWLWNLNLEISESHNGKRIVEIPTPHGDLIDRKQITAMVRERFCDRACDRQNVDCGRCGVNIIIDELIGKSPTIIEAEEVKE